MFGFIFSCIDFIGKFLYPEYVDCGRCSGSGIDADKDGLPITCESCDGHGKVYL